MLLAKKYNLGDEPTEKLSGQLFLALIAMQRKTSLIIRCILPKFYWAQRPNIEVNYITQTAIVNVRKLPHQNLLDKCI